MVIKKSRFRAGPKTEARLRLRTKTRAENKIKNSISNQANENKAKNLLVVVCDQQPKDYLFANN